MGKLIVMIDGNYLRMAAKRHGIEYFDHRFFVNKLKEKLSEMLGTSLRLLRTYYYDAPPFSDESKLKPKEIEFARRRQAFLDRLNQLDLFEVRLGRIQYKGRDEKGNLITAQKGVDVKMAVDIIEFAEHKTADYILLITSDSDLVPAIRVAKNKGVNVILGMFPPKHKHSKLVKELSDSADMRILFDDDMFSKYK